MTLGLGARVQERSNRDRIGKRHSYSGSRFFSQRSIERTLLCRRWPVITWDLSKESLRLYILVQGQSLNTTTGWIYDRNSWRMNCIAWKDADIWYTLDFNHSSPSVTSWGIDVHLVIGHRKVLFYLIFSSLAVLTLCSVTSLLFNVVWPSERAGG